MNAMSVPLHISAKLHGDKKTCTLTYSDSTCHLQLAICLPKLVAESLLGSYEYTPALGTALYQLLDGDNRYLARAREQARHAGETLALHLTLDPALQDLPFELLHDGHFLLPGEMHLIRQVGDRGRDRILAPANRPLKLLFMACSPLDLKPVLDFEKEEETIFRATDRLPIDIVVEDSGSLAGLEKKLSAEKFDLIHLSGHAELAKDGTPYFWMEDDEGHAQRVYPPALWRVLRLNPPNLLFLAGCQTGQVDPNHATASFAQQMVGEGIPAVLSWGRPVYDLGATEAAKQLYFELSRGQDLASALLACRRALSEAPHYAVHSVWPLLRLFADATPLTPLVTVDQKPKPTVRKLAHAYLANGKVKILTAGFVGRRRYLQTGLRVLRHGQDDPSQPQVGVLLHGTAGLGKSCLAGKLIERLADRDTTLVVVHGRLDAATFSSALELAFAASKDDPPKAILAQKRELPEKLRELCLGPWQEKRYLILLDDFEQNFEKQQQNGQIVPVFREGYPVLEPTAAAVLYSLLHDLPLTAGMVSLIITSRYLFRLADGDTDLVQSRLRVLGLTSFGEVEQRKKAGELPHINAYPHPETRADLIAAGHGNPRLMEFIDELVARKKSEEIPALLAAVRDKQEEYVRDYVLEALLATQPPEFRATLRRASVFRIPVKKDGMLAVCSLPPANLPLADLQLATTLSLMEHDHRADTLWVTPLLREKLFAELAVAEQQQYHRSAYQYWQANLNPALRDYFEEAEELLYHASAAGELEVACKEGANLVKRLRERLAYAESKRVGKWLLTSMPSVPETDNGSFLLNAVGYTLQQIGENRHAIAHFEQALAIDRKVFGDEYPGVATELNNLGVAYEDLGEKMKAISFFEQALVIDRKVFGEAHPNMARDLNNLGVAWSDLGEEKKAISFYEQALAIDRKVFGDEHPNMARDLNNLGSAWSALGEKKKAISFYEQALAVFKKAFGEEHPNVSTLLNSLGSAWSALGEKKKAIGFYEKALIIHRKVFGEAHPNMARDLNNLGAAWFDLGEKKKAISFFEQALTIDRKVFGDEHPNVAIRLNNLGMAWSDLGEKKKAISFYEQALVIDRNVFGEEHPNVARGLNNLGMAWSALGEKKKAISFYEQALTIDRKVFGDEHPNVAIELNNLGAAWSDLGEKKKAISFYEQALAIDRKVFGDEHPNVARGLNNLGMAWSALGEKKKAISFYEQALTIDRKVFGDEHPNVARELNNLGMALAATGEQERGQACLKRAYEIWLKFYGPEHPDTQTALRNLQAVGK
jgi:tetratricopeptide (TPR) repeat protein